MKRNPDTPAQVVYGDGLTSHITQVFGSNFHEDGNLAFGEVVRQLSGEVELCIIARPTAAVAAFASVDCK